MNGNLLRVKIHCYLASIPVALLIWSGATATFAQEANDDGQSPPKWGTVVFKDQTPQDEHLGKWLAKYSSYQFGDKTDKYINTDDTLTNRAIVLKNVIEGTFSVRASRLEVVLDSYQVKGYVPDYGEWVKSTESGKQASKGGRSGRGLISLLLSAVKPSSKDHPDYHPTSREYCEGTIIIRVNGARLEVSAREPVIGEQPVMKRLTEHLTRDIVATLTTM